MSQPAVAEETQYLAESQYVCVLKHAQALFIMLYLSLASVCTEIRTSVYVDFNTTFVVQNYAFSLYLISCEKFMRVCVCACACVYTRGWGRNRERHCMCE